MTEIVIIAMKIIETNHTNKEIICADVLAYPTLELKDFDSIDIDEYEWEERDFEYPLFHNQKPNDVFLTKTEITADGFVMKIYENEELLNKAKKAFKDFSDRMAEKFEELGKSSFFDKKLTTWEDNDKEA